MISTIVASNYYENKETIKKKKIIINGIHIDLECFLWGIFEKWLVKLEKLSFLAKLAKE